MAEYKKLKYYFDKELAKLISGKIEQVYPEFQSKKFVKTIADSVDDMELKARVEVITDALHHYLPADYKKGAGILLQILGPENENETGMFKEGYWLMPVAFFVEKYGCDDFKTSINAIYEITKRHTGEYAVRPFLDKYPQKMLSIMKDWSKDKNFHVRRLASEGVRPRLPWAKKMEPLIADPTPILPILENLKEDESLFVRKSVANNLNDILKDNYTIAMRVLKKWSKRKSSETKWIIKHALRKEIKKGNPQALQLIDKLKSSN